ncbi:MAG: GntR family transcriptional regulator [Mangrovibacterium sp.]
MAAEANKIPQYKKLYEVLRRHILSGTYEEGSLLPSENELCAVHNTTRPTVRHALEALVQDGFITKKQGKRKYCPEAPAGYRYSVYCCNIDSHWQTVPPHPDFAKTAN